MELSGRPLLDTKPDHKLFAGRNEELDRLVESVEQRLNVLLIGERGLGKTTLLRQLAYTLRERNPASQRPAFVEGGLATDPKTFLDLVRVRLGLQPAVLQPNQLEAMVQAMSRKAVLDDTLEMPRLVQGLREAAKDGARVVLVDELDPDIGQTLFGRLRDEMWQLPITWVVAVADTNAGPFLSDPARPFFDTVFRLRPLSKEARARLLQSRLGNRGANLAKQLDEGNPRRLLALARESLQGKNRASQMHRARIDREERLAELGRSAFMLMAELESLGPASASDERLLKRLGWTRPRAVQVFRQLEEAGVVTSETVKGDSGRPRKVYRPNDLITKTQSEP